MALFKTLKQATDAKWVVDIIASAAGKHRCFTEHFKVQDATTQYKETCGPLITEMVKNKSCYQTRKYVINCLDTSKVDSEFLEKWFVFAPTVLSYFKREKRPILFINDIVEISSRTYTWDRSVESIILELIKIYGKTHSIYIDDTWSLYHPMLESLSFRSTNIGGIIYWRYGGVS